MLYSPYSTDDDWENNRMPTDSSLLLMEDGGPHAVVVIPLPEDTFESPEHQGANDARAEESHPAEVVAREPTRAIDYFDLEAFVVSFSEDVTMFYPIAALSERVERFRRSDLACRSGRLLAADCAYPLLPLLYIENGVRVAASTSSSSR